MLRPMVFLLAGAVALAASGGAQNCAGRGSFRDGRFAFGGLVTATGGSGGLGVYGNYGRPTSWYAGASIGTTIVSGGGGKSLDLGASLGYQLPFGRSAISLCPYVFASNSTRGNVSQGPFTGATTRTEAYGFGGTMGWRYEDSDGLDIIPALGAQWQRLGVTSPGFRWSGPTNSGSASFSLGFIADRQWSIVPGVSSSFSSGTSYVFLLSVGYNFGK
jgi:hypothetical protein